MKKLDQYVPEMCDAHRRGDLAAVRKLLKAYPGLEKMGPDDDYPWLHFAAEEGQIPLIEFWLDRGWDVNHNSASPKD